jgi:DNA-binding MarR family transcriptional regulator
MKTKEEKLNRIISLIFMMRKLSHENNECQRKSISMLQYMTLRFIKDKQPLMKEVAESFDITPPSATSLVDTLAKVGLVKRLEDSNDRRIKRIVITKKGENMLEQRQKEVADHMRKKLEKLNESELESLTKILSKFI